MAKAAETDRDATIKRVLGMYLEQRKKHSEATYKFEEAKRNMEHSSRVLEATADKTHRELSKFGEKIYVLGDKAFVVTAAGIREVAMYEVNKGREDY
jgi:chaperonin cofactor prefoldin